VLVEASGGDKTGLGYPYADRATGVFVDEHLRDRAIGCDVMTPQATWEKMRRAIRNLGRPGVASMAIAAVDTALWDLKARVLDVPLVQVLGAKRASVPLYGSGGFTSYSDRELADQMAGFVASPMRSGLPSRATAELVRSAQSRCHPEPTFSPLGALGNSACKAVQSVMSTHGGHR
jgi:L-alanine-DL-glutamate epimerase-like enolase superfamily enzyme